MKSQGRLSVGSSRDREISMSVGLGRSQLDSRGGVVGGTIDVNTLEMVGKLESCLLLVHAPDINEKNQRMYTVPRFVNLLVYTNFGSLLVFLTELKG